MGRKGWWRQIQSDDYPETQTNYGDPGAINSRSTVTQVRAKIEGKPIPLTRTCPKCGNTYWSDLRCNNCGYRKHKGKKSSKKNPKPVCAKQINEESLAVKCTKEKNDSLLKSAIILKCTSCKHAVNVDHKLMKLIAAGDTYLDKASALALLKKNHSKLKCPMCSNVGPVIVCRSHPIKEMEHRKNN